MRSLCFLLIVVCLGACSNSVSIESLNRSRLDLEADTLSGMIRVTAVGAQAVLGTDDSLVALSEMPSMKVLLDYSFSIGRHEVTCGEFNDLMEPATGLRLDCDGDSVPATDLTYYDAVLFANERSKAENLDTAYTYTSIRFDDQKHCVGMEGFIYRATEDAYRLPTEAEWVLVAQKHLNVDKAWVSENSNYKLHKVCALEKDPKIPCDMAGNAMEWMNDWLGFFKDTTVTNYVGGPDGGNLGERVVKGGSYQNSAERINLYSRGDVYTVTSSTRAGYVGFRLAFGKIPEATWIGYNGLTITSRISPLVNSTSIRSVSETYKMKLAFRNNLTGNLSFIDYSTGVLYVAEIEDTIPVYHPEISPNGEYVAFCTGMEGVSGNSQIYLRRLDLNGGNAVKLNVKNAALPRWRILENGDTVLVYVSDAGNNKEEGTFSKTSTWQVIVRNGRFLKPVKLFNGAYHGGISEDRRLAVTGARLLRARLAKGMSTVTGKARDTVWYNGEQACNVSLAQDSSKKTLFLDFGGSTGQSFAGEKYGTHERLLVADSTGQLVQTVAAPSGYSFDHAEWVQGRSNLAVATLTNAQGAHTKVVLVNMEDGQIMDLVEAEDLWHPCFWMHRPIEIAKFDLDPDSAGVYMNSDDDFGAVLMRFNMELLWRYRDSANVVVVGSSRPLTGVCPKCFGRKFFAVNLAHTPNSIYASRDYLDMYVYKHFSKLKYIVLSLDIDFWYKVDGPEGDNFFVKDYSKYPGYVYDENHGFWESGYPEGLLEYTENYLTVPYERLYVEDRGRKLGMECKSWGTKAEVEMDSTYYDERENLIEHSMAALEDIIRKAKEHDVTVVGLIFPQNPKYRKTGAFGRYGLRRSRAQTLIKEIRGLEKTFSNFKLMDENKMGKHGYADRFASDNDHLCSMGSPVLTKKVDSLLKTLE